MERLILEDNKKSARRSKHFILKETIHVNDERTRRIDQLKRNDGELPLFFSNSSPHLSSKANDLNFDHKLVKPEWPLGSQESGPSASSFQFELDTQDDERLQAMLERDKQIPIGEANLGWKLTDRQSLMESDTIKGGSVRFIRNEELQSCSQYGHLKSPRQHGSLGFTTVFNANESEGYDIVAQSSGSLNIGPARIKVAVNDHVPVLPRSEVLRRLRDLKAHPLSPRFSSEDIASFQKERVVVNNINSPSPDYVHSRRVAIPFTWEEEPGKPKTIALAMDRVLPHRLSKDGIEYMKLQSSWQKCDVKSSVENGHSKKGTGPEASGLSLPSSKNVDQRSGSHRYYGRDYLTGLSREASFRRSTKRYSIGEKEALIDLDGSPAAKFLVEAFESPSRAHASSPTLLVPFKWEDAPGKAKVETIAQKPNVLQLPPRLALPSLNRPESFSSHGHRSSSSFGGFFLPCLVASTPVHQKQSTSSYNLPPRLQSSPERRTRLGVVNRCSSTPKEGCQVWVSKSRTLNHINSEKLLTEPQLTPSQKCTNLSVLELKTKSNAPSSPTNILCRPDKGNSQTSGSSIMFSSGDLEDFTKQTQKSVSKSSSSTSFEYAEENLVEFPVAATAKLDEDTRLFNKKGVPTSSGYLNSKGEPLTLGTLTTLQSKATNSSPEASPKCPSKLPYTMPFVAEQFLASCSTSGRRQLLQDLSPRLLYQFSSKRHSRSHSGVNIPYQHLTSANDEKVVSSSPALIASVELFSSFANQQTPKALVPKPPPAKPRRRIRLMSSIFKILKRALSRKKRSLKQSEPMRTYFDGGKSPAVDF